MRLYESLDGDELRQRIRKTGVLLLKKHGLLAMDGPEEALRRGSFEGVATRDLLSEVLGAASSLLDKEAHLAREELKSDIERELGVVKGLGLSGACGIVAINLAFVALVFALSESGVASGWLVALIIAATALLAGILAGFEAWSKRVITPLAETRKSVKENLLWVRERIA